jgi:ParB family chromosome partitioning protein
MKIEVSKLRLPEHDLRASVDEEALEGLADSIKEHGQLQPIGVKKLENGEFEVVFGARRTRAFNILGLKMCEAVLVEAGADGSQSAKKLIENVQREDLTAIEEAYGLIELIGEGEANVRKLQQQTGKSREWIKGRLDLLDLPEDVQALVQTGTLGIGVARHLGQITHDDTRAMYLESAIENGCTESQAAVWESQSKFAEQGIIAMTNSAEQNEELQKEPQIVDQQYHCFKCGTLHNWRRVNTLVLCGTCQNDIAEGRTTNAK